MGASSRTSWLRRLLAVALRILGAASMLLVFLTSLLLGAVLHMDLPIVRRGAGDFLENYLTQTLQGRIEIGSLSRLEEGGIGIDDLEVFDPSGRSTLKLDHLSTNIDPWAIGQRVLAGHEKLSIEISAVSAEGCEISLHPTTARDKKGQLLAHPSLQDALSPVKKAKKKKKKKATKKRPVRIWFPYILLKNVHARGSIAGSPVVETHIAEARTRVLVTEKGLALDVDRFALTASGLLGVDTKAHGEVHVRAPGAIWGKVWGELGDIPIEQEFRFKADKFNLKTLAILEPAAVRPHVPDWPLDQTIAVENRAKGSLSKVKINTTISSPNAPSESKPARIRGTIHPDKSRAKLHLTLESLNLQHYDTLLPGTSLSGTVDADILYDESSRQAELKVALAPSQLDGQPLPELAASASWTPAGWEAEGELSESGLRAKFSASQPVDGELVATMNLPPTNLGSSPRLRTLIGSADGSIAGQLKIRKKEGEVSGALNLDVDALQHSGFAVGRAQLRSNFTSPLDAPAESTANTTLTAEHAELGAVQFTKFKLTQSGALLNPALKVEATTRRGMTLEASSHLSVEDQSLAHFSAELRGRSKPVRAEAKRIRYADGSLTLRQFVIRSIGEITGDIEWNSGGGTIDVSASGLDVSRIGQSLGLAATELGGKLDANIDLAVGRGSRGTVNIKLRDGAFQGVSGVELDGYAQIEGRTTSGKLNGEITGLFELQSSWDGELAGPMLSPSSYTNAKGELSAQLLGLDLTTVRLLLGSALPFSSLGGEIDLKLLASRQDGDRVPELTLEAQSRGLDVGYGEGIEEIRSRSIDFSFVGKVPSDGSKLESVVRLKDPVGILASLSGELQLPLAEWIETSPQSDTLVGELQNSELNWVVVVPERRMQEWPSFLPQPFGEGSFGARAAVSGPLGTPNINVVLSLKDIERGESPFSEPVDINSTLQYTTSTGKLAGSLVFNRDSQRMGSMQLDINVPKEHLTTELPVDTPFWTGRAQVQLDSSPLALLQSLKDARVQGTALGTISIERHEYLPEVAAELSLRRVSAGPRYLGDARLESLTHGTDLTTQVDFKDDYGSLTANALLGIVADPYLFSLDPSRPIRIELESQSYDAAVLHPFVADIFDELGGALDGKLSAELIPTGNENAPWDTRLNGRMTLKNGVMTPSSLGLKFEDASFSLYAERTPSSNFIRLENLKAKAGSTEENVRGRAEVQFKNLDLQGGAFELYGEKLPVLSNGTKQADVTGGLTGRFILLEDQLKLSVSFRDFTAVLPENSKSNLIPLDDNETISIVQHETLAPETEEGAVSLPMLIEFKLGENVRVKNSMLDLRLRGKPQMRLGEKMEMAGAIDLVRGGRFVVLGRSFLMERGIVLFDTGDATNPHIQATASWRAPNGVLVRVGVRGTVKNPILDWSSEPALPGGEPDVIALVLGSGGGADQGSVGMSSLAIAANEAIGASGLNWMEFYTTQQSGGGEGRVASLTDSSWNNYTAAIQISDELWFEGNYQSGSTGFQAEHRQGVSGTLDWRFHPQWSARTEVGTLGGGLDLLWQYRY